MSEPDEVRFACIGCGAMNPAGAEVCSGCGHRFAGPGSGPIPGSVTGPAPLLPEMHFRDDEFYKAARPNHDETLLGCLAKVVGFTLAVIATLVAFVVAFFVTCSATIDSEGVWFFSIIAGVAAAGGVVAFTIWIGSIMGGYRR